MRYVRVYVRGVKGGELGMGSREVFVINDDTVYPDVYSIATGSISNLIQDDYSGAVDKEVTPQMATSILRILGSKKKSTDTKAIDAEIAIMKYCNKIINYVPATRVRTRKRAEEPTTRQRVRKRAEQEVKPTKTRNRRRAR